MIICPRADPAEPVPSRMPDTVDMACELPARAGCEPRSIEIEPTIRLYGPETVTPTVVMTREFQNIYGPEKYIFFL